MADALTNAIRLLLVAYVTFWIIFGWPNNDIKDTVISKMLFGEESTYKKTTRKNKNEFKNYTYEIFNFEFEAYGEFGIRRRSIAIGQAFDFLKFSGII